MTGDHPVPIETLHVLNYQTRFTIITYSQKTPNSNTTVSRYKGDSGCVMDTEDESIDISSIKRAILRPPSVSSDPCAVHNYQVSTLMASTSLHIAFFAAAYFRWQRSMFPYKAYFSPCGCHSLPRRAECRRINNKHSASRTTGNAGIFPTCKHSAGLAGLATTQQHLELFQTSCTPCASLSSQRSLFEENGCPE